jgi:hypothetical protein
MESSRWWLGVTALTLLGIAATGVQRLDQERAWERRIEELRARARPAEERLARGPADDDLRARLAKLERELMALAPPDGAPAVQAFHEVRSDADPAPYHAWVARAQPALATWLHSELCGTPPAGAPPGSEEWMPLRQRVWARLGRGQRIAVEPPRLLVLRNWANCLAWHAFFEARNDSREPWELDAAGILASVFPLALAYDDASFLGTMVRIAVEQQVVAAARALLAQGALPAPALRAELDPWLARSAAFEPREMLAGELRAFLALHEHTGAGEGGRELLEHFAGVEEAFELAERSPADLRAAPGGDPPGGFLSVFRSALAGLHRHRSVLALGRVALAIEEQRARTGALPGHLERLTAAFADGLPLDPLTGAPFSYRLEGGRARLGPAACPEHGSDECRDMDWPAAVEQLLAWEFPPD